MLDSLAAITIPAWLAVALIFAQGTAAYIVGWYAGRKDGVLELLDRYDALQRRRHDPGQADTTPPPAR